MNTTPAQAFYDHKREAHRGDFKATCGECQTKWAALVEASKKKAGL